MKIVNLLGSPRPKGNSATMAGMFCGAATKLGGRVETYSLNSMDFKGCQGCETCKKKLDRCVLKDDLTPVLEAVRECDVLVMSTPVYYGDVSSQLKAFIDRTFSYLVPEYWLTDDKSRLTPGKALVFVIAQGHVREDLNADIYPRYKMFFNWLGFTQSHLIRACGVYFQGEADQRKDIRELAEETAKKVMQA